MTGKHKDNSLRNIEYYGLFEMHDKLYRQSQENIVFDDSMPLIVRKDKYQNIIVVDKNVKRNLIKKDCGIMEIIRKNSRKEDTRKFFVT